MKNRGDEDKAEVGNNAEVKKLINNNTKPKK
jgi:hypothetical protein